ncbi:MAG: shikimate kinase [Aggregatilineales bacterium]
MNKSENIVLTGFMGTGKTTVGKALARRLDRVFFDMDAAIEHRTGLTIPRIFASYSEPFFRAIERGLAHELALQENLVIATGGGALLDKESYEALSQTGFIVCFMASPDVIEERLRQSDDRPLAGRWREIFTEREPTYAAMPNQIQTDTATPEALAEEVIALWQTHSQ